MKEFDFDFNLVNVLQQNEPNGRQKFVKTLGKLRIAVPRDTKVKY